MRPEWPKIGAKGRQRAVEFLGTGSKPKGFPLFSARRMASTDSIILLIVDHKQTKYPIQS